MVAGGRRAPTVAAGVLHRWWPDLGGELDGRVLEGLIAYSLLAPSVAPRTNRRWKMTKMIVTGIRVNRAAPSLSGYWVPAPSDPETRSARPRGRVKSSGLCTATSVCGNSFQELWNDRMV